MTGKVRIITAFCLSIILLVLTGIYTYRNTHEYKRDSEWVSHTQLVISQAQKLLSDVQDIETAYRGYVITGETEFLIPYDESRINTERSFVRLKEMTKDNPSQQVLLASINRAIKLKINFAKLVVASRKVGDFEDAQNFITTNAGEKLMRKIKVLIARFLNQETILLSKRLANARENFSETITYIISSVILTILLALITLYFFIKDHNKRLNSEKKLLESELRIKQFLESLPVGIFVLGMDGKPYYANSKSFEILGRGIMPDASLPELPETYQAYITGTNKLYPADQLPIVRALKGEKNICVEDLEILKDDTRIPLRINSTHLTNSKGKIEFAISVFEDITIVKQNERLLKNNETILRSIFEGSKALICMHDMEGVFSRINIAGLQSIGYNADELIGKNIKEILDPQFRPLFNKYISDIKEKGMSEGIMKVVNKNGNTHFWLYKNRMLYGIDGEPYVLGSALDITDRVSAEQELVKAKKLAEESVILKETFLANMSHEIRTPLNAIIGFTDLLLKKNLEAQEKDYVRTIKVSGENLLRIINDILDISKIQSGMMTFEEHPISIKQLFGSLNTMLSYKANEKKLNLSFEYDNNLPGALLGDPTRLTQIILNLAGNAIKFTKTGSVEVFAKLLEENDDNCKVEFTIKDTGIGIPEDKLLHIFERFRQAESHTTRSYGGTGLGLSIAKQLVELQGGKIGVKSVVGLGSVFTFSLSFKKTNEDYSDIPNLTNESKVDELAKLKILLAEDNPINIKFVLSLFADHNIKADIAENGKLALEKFKNNSYDIVLMDIEMPEMNGYETTEIIRNEIKSNVPIIAMTAHAMSGEKEKCIRSGMDDYISKPIKAELLFEKMLLAVASKGSTAPSNKIVNLHFLVSSMNGNRQVILDTIEIFLEQVPEDLAVINEAVSKADYSTIKRFAHRLKSSISLMGISSMERILDEIETLGVAEKDIEKIRKLNSSLNELNEQAIQEIQIEKINYS